MGRAAYVNAEVWRWSPSGEFEVVADVAPLMKSPEGVYTVVIISEVDGELVELTTHTLFVREE